MLNHWGKEFSFWIGLLTTDIRPFTELDGVVISADNKHVVKDNADSTQYVSEQNEKKFMEEKDNLKRELQRTDPDYIVYVPKSLDGSTFDTGNEHFLVFDGPKTSL